MVLRSHIVFHTNVLFLSIEAANAEVAAALHPLILADPSLRLRRLDIETFRNLRVVKLYLPFYVFSTTSKVRARLWTVCCTALVTHSRGYPQKPLKTYISGYNTYTLGQERYSLGASAAVAAAFTLSYDKLMPRITVSDIFAAAADTIKGLKPFAESVTDTVVPSSGSMTFGETVLFVSLTMMLVDGINDRKTRAYDRLENNPHALRMAFNAFAEEVRKSGLRRDFFDQRPAYKVRAEQEVERLRRLAEEQVRQRHEAAEAAKRAAATAEEERRRQQLAKEEAERLQREHEAEEERRRQSAAADYLRRPTDPRGYYAFLGVQPNATKEVFHSRTVVLLSL